MSERITKYEIRHYKNRPRGVRRYDVIEFILILNNWEPAWISQCWTLGGARKKCRALKAQYEYDSEWV